MEYELSCNYDSRKSFYGKANVRQEDGKTILRSYSTDVAYIKDGNAIVFGTYSNTTLRHIKEFLKQHGFTAKTSSQIMTDYQEPKKVQKEREQQEEQKASSMLKSIGLVASLGEVICKTQ